MSKRRAIAWILLALASAGIGVVFLVVGGTVAVSRGWQRERVRALLETTLNRALLDAGFEGTVRIGALSGGLYPEFALHDVVLERGGVRLARIREADVALDARRLYADRVLVFDRVRLEGVEASLAQEPDGSWPFEPRAQTAAEPEPAAERPLALVIHELELVSAQVDVVWTQDGQPSHLAGAVEGGARELVLPRAGEPPWPKSAHTSAVLSPGLVGGRALLGAHAAVELDGSHLRLARSELDSAFGKVRLVGETDVAGWLDPAAPASAHLEAEADSLDLAVLLGRRELAGSFGGKLLVDATHTAGTELRASHLDASLALAKSRVGRLQVSSGELRGTYDAGRWRIDRALLVSSAGRVEAKGSGDLDKIAALDADLDIRDLGALAAVARADASGQARAKLHLSGPWRAPDGTLQLDASALRTAGVDVGSVKLSARSTGLDRYRIEPFALDGPLLFVSAQGPVLLRRAGDGVQIERAELRLAADEAVSLRGRVSPAAVRDLRVELGHVALAHLAPLAGVSPRLGGHVSGTVTANGALPRPALAGDLTWQAPQVGEVSAESIAVALSTRAGVLHAEGRISARGQELLRASLAMPWSARSDPTRALEQPETLLLIDGSELDLALVQELLPPTVQRVEGKVNVHVELRGGNPEPTLDGELTVRAASWDVPVLAERFGPLDARLVLSRESLRIDSFVLHEGRTGTATLAGEVRLVDLRPGDTDLRLELHDFPVRWQTTVQTHAFGALGLRGPLDALVAKGEIELRMFRYSLAGGTDPLLGEVRVRDSSAEAREKVAASAQAQELWDNASVDVRVDIPNDGRVQGQGANLEIAGQLVAAKKAGGPLLVTGAIDTQHGSYRIKGRTFIVEQARVEFTGRPDLDPDLDVRAMHRVRNIRVYAVVRGRASAPQVKLSSDPPYPQDDVLALLLFGRTRDELSQQQAGALQSALAGTAGVAALDTLNDALGFTIPIDTVEVEDTDSQHTELGVGGYLTEDVFVRYGHGFGQDAESDVRVDWRFHKPWSIETTLSSGGDSSADLIWTYDY